jgi:hypothetical protein
MGTGKLLSKHRHNSYFRIRWYIHFRSLSGPYAMGVDPDTY